MEHLFDFPLESSLSTTLSEIFTFFLIAVLVVWSSGYAYKDPHLREAPSARLPRANLWATITAGIGVALIILCALTWRDNFSRMELDDAGKAKLWFGYPQSKKVTLNKSDVDSIHYGVRKGGDCYVRIQLKDGKSYQSTWMYDDQCANAYHALQHTFSSQ